MRQPKVFTSYTHDSPEHKDRVLQLSDRLRSEGVDSHIDQYEVSPPEGWPAWMRRQIREADFVIVVCTETYQRRYEGREASGKGLGAKWEGGIITQELYESEGRNTKFVPVVFSKEDVKHIPAEMRGGTYYILDGEAEYEDLYRHLTDQPKTVKREMGKLRSLPPLDRKEDFSAPAAVPPPVVSPAPATPAALAARAASGPLSWVLIVTPEGHPLFVEAESIRSGKTLKMTLVPANPREAAGIDALRRRARGPLGVAYNLTALFAHARSVEQVVEGGREVWHVELEPDENANSGPGTLGEFSMGGRSPDEIAEMRAQLILLDEQPYDSKGRATRDLNAELLAHSVQGGFGSQYQVAGSPFPALYEAAKGNADEFLEAARLNAVLLLRLTHTVEHIHRLELRMEGEGKLRVDFEGRRRAQYVNHDPHVIHVEGVCGLDSKK